MASRVTQNERKKKEKKTMHSIEMKCCQHFDEKKNACDQNADTSGTILHVRPVLRLIITIRYLSTFSYSSRRLTVCKRQHCGADSVLFSS